MRSRAWRLPAAALLVALASSDAVASCPPTDQYDYSVNVGVLLGLTFIPRVQFTYGLDVRLGRGPLAGFARVEGHGRLYAQYLAGIDYVHHPAHGEVAVALNGPHSDGGAKSALGLHLAFGDWNSFAGAQLQGVIPAVGDRRNWDAGLSVFGVIPGGLFGGVACAAE
jgi:hypothetical protein